MLEEEAHRFTHGKVGEEGLHKLRRRLSTQLRGVDNPVELLQHVGGVLPNELGLEGLFRGWAGCPMLAVACPGAGPCAACGTWPQPAKTTLQLQMARRASESRGVGPVAAAEPATTVSATVAAYAASAAFWEEGATGVAAVAGGPRQAAQAVAAAPPYLGVTNVTRR